MPIAASMATTSGWVTEDARRPMHAEVRVADIQQHVDYYTKHFGMTLLERSSGDSATLGYGPGKFAIRVVQHDPQQEGPLDLGSGFGHFGIVLPVGGLLGAAGGWMGGPCHARHAGGHAPMHPCKLDAYGTGTSCDHMPTCIAPLARGTVASRSAIGVIQLCVPTREGPHSIGVIQ